ncbi:MAG: type IV pilus biogenesis/stability protein PilW [Candidatus Contendobacter sp.]|nr:MAG: type IV pilus biogenesis/stability protein PilW [Candidatus Contendobacter sp.]
MRRSVKPMTLFLALLLGACAGSERDFKDNVAEANFKLGVGYMQSGNFQVATEKLTKALQYNDDYPEAHNALAVLYEEIREYGPAETHYKRAIDSKPDYTLAKLNYARFLCTREPIRTAEGESAFEKIAADPASAGASAADAYAGLGLCARQRNDPAQAETWLRKALELDPNNTSALYALAELSQTQNKTLQGRAFLQRYHARTRPTAQSLWLGVAIEQASDGDSQLRREYGVLLLSQFPNSDEARRLKQPK